LGTIIIIILKTASLIIIFLSIYLSSLSQNCHCIDYEFSSSKESPIFEFGENNNKLIICGYSNVNLDNGFKSGVKQSDSSIYLCGFNVFSCSDSVQPLLSFGELKEFKLSLIDNSPSLDLIMNLPVDKELNFIYSPVIRISVSLEKGKWVAKKPIIILNFSKLTEYDFFMIKKDLGWDNLYPEFMFKRDESYAERRILNAFVLALRYFPKYNQDFNNMKELDGALLELHDELSDILSDLD
jgi:hypothetical protein